MTYQLQTILVVSISCHVLVVLLSEGESEGEPTPPISPPLPTPPILTPG